MATADEFQKAYETATGANNNAQAGSLSDPNAVSGAVSSAATGGQVNGYNFYNEQQANMVNDIYTKNAENQRQQLQSAYDQNVATLKEQQEKINPLYNNQANSLGSQYEINRRNMNTQLAANGLGTGSGSQAMLAQQASYNQNMGNLRTQQANAQAEAERQQANLKMQYTNQIQAALAQNDLERAKALYTEYGNQQNQLANDAALLAQFGDYSKYEQLYGSEISGNMQTIWNYQNPDLAYQVGNIDAEKYKEITGKYPKGYKPAGSGSSYSGDTFFTGTDGLKYGYKPGSGWQVMTPNGAVGVSSSDAYKVRPGYGGN